MHALLITGNANKTSQIRSNVELSNIATLRETQDTIAFISFLSLSPKMHYRGVVLNEFYLAHNRLVSINLFTHPNSEPKNPLDGVSFFSASAINCNAFCSLSAIVAQVLQSLCKSTEYKFAQITKLRTICVCLLFCKTKIHCCECDVYFV